MNVTRLEPYGLFSLLNPNLYPMADRRFGIVGRDKNRNTDWAPAVDIVEEKDRFVLRADLPGVLPDAIDIRMDNRTLTLSGERHHDIDRDENGLHRIERITGRFERRFSMPEIADCDKVSARSSNGILEISIPRLPENQHRRITVEAA